MKCFINFPNDIGINSDGEVCLKIDLILNIGDIFEMWHENGNDLIYLKITKRVYSVSQEMITYICSEIKNPHI